MLSSNLPSGVITVWQVNNDEIDDDEGVGIIPIRTLESKLEDYQRSEGTANGWPLPCPVAMFAPGNDDDNDRGRYMVGRDGPHWVKIWRTHDWTCVKTIEVKGSPIQDVQFFPDDDDDKKGSNRGRLLIRTKHWLITKCSINIERGSCYNLRHTTGYGTRPAKRPRLRCI